MPAALKIDPISAPRPYRPLEATSDLRTPRNSPAPVSPITRYLDIVLFQHLPKEPSAQPSHLLDVPPHRFGRVIPRHEAHFVVQPGGEKRRCVVLLVGIDNPIGQMVVPDPYEGQGVEVTDDEEPAVLLKPIDLGHRTEQMCPVDPMKHVVNDNEVERFLQRDRMGQRVHKRYFRELHLPVPDRTQRRLNGDHFAAIVLMDESQPVPIGRSYLKDSPRTETVELHQPQWKVL